jgi:hypothetical protein
MRPRKLHRIFKALMSVTTTALKKDITARKFLKFGLCQFLLLVKFTNPKSGLDSKALSWLFGSVVFYAHVLNEMPTQ